MSWPLTLELPLPTEDPKPWPGEESPGHQSEQNVGLENLGHWAQDIGILVNFNLDLTRTTMTHNVFEMLLALAPWHRQQMELGKGPKNCIGCDLQTYGRSKSWKSKASSKQHIQDFGLQFH